MNLLIDLKKKKYQQELSGSRAIKWKLAIELDLYCLTCHVCLLIAFFSRAVTEWLPYDSIDAWHLPDLKRTTHTGGGSGGFEWPLHAIIGFMVRATSGRAGGNHSSNAIKMLESIGDVITRLREQEQLIRPSSLQWLNFYVLDAPSAFQMLSWQQINMEPWSDWADWCLCLTESNNFLFTLLIGRSFKMLYKSNEWWLCHPVCRNFQMCLEQTLAD